MSKSANGISKENSMLLYGVAILLMIYHHLFGFPGRLNGDYISILNCVSGIENFDIMLGKCCKLCVAIYVFVSGYGCYLGSRNNDDKESFNDNIVKVVVSNYRTCLKRIFGFMIKYWLVFFVFLPIGYFNGCFSFSSKELFKTFIGYKAYYNLEWWYVNQYIILMLSFPILKMIADCISTRLLKYGFLSLISICLIIGLAAAFSTAGLFNTIANKIYHTSFVYSLIFFEGMLVAKFDWIKIPKIIQQSEYITAGVAFCYCVIFKYLTFPLLNDKFVDIYVIVPFVYAVCILLAKAKVGLMYLGKYSLYMWLTHTFFCYYYWGHIVIQARYSVLIYMATLLGALVASLVLSKLENIIFTLIGMRKNYGSR